LPVRPCASRATTRSRAAGAKRSGTVQVQLPVCGRLLASMYGNDAPPLTDNCTSTELTCSSSSAFHSIEICCCGCSTSPPFGVLTYAVGESPPRCAGTCMTMQCITPDAVTMPWHGTCTTVLPGSAVCHAASAWLLCGATVEFV